MTCTGGRACNAPRGVCVMCDARMKSDACATSDAGPRADAGRSDAGSLWRSHVVAAHENTHWLTLKSTNNHERESANAGFLFVLHAMENSEQATTKLFTTTPPHDSLAWSHFETRTEISMAAIDAVSVEARQALVEVMMQVAWADRELAPEERQAAHAAAISLGLVLPGEPDIVGGDRQPSSLNELRFDGLVTRDLELLYVCAEWMALADSVEQQEEKDVLAALRIKLSVSELRSVELRALATSLHEKQVVERSSWWRAFDRLVVEAARLLSHRT